MNLIVKLLFWNLSIFYKNRENTQSRHELGTPFFRWRLTEFLLFFRGFIHLGAGLSVGFSGLAAGFAIGIVGDAGVRGTAQQPRLFVGMILILIFAEVLGLYGLIVAIYLYTK